MLVTCLYSLPSRTQQHYSSSLKQPHIICRKFFKRFERSVPTYFLLGPAEALHVYLFQSTISHTTCRNWYSSTLKLHINLPFVHLNNSSEDKLRIWSSWVRMFHVGGHVLAVYSHKNTLWYWQEWKSRSGSAKVHDTSPALFIFSNVWSKVELLGTQPLLTAISLFYLSELQYNT